MHSLVSLFCLLTVCLVSPQLEAEKWSHVKTIGQSVSFSSDVAVDPNGDAVSVFIHFDGVTQRVQSAIRPFGKHWITLPEFLSAQNVAANDPRIAMAPNGNATAVWTATGTSDPFVQVATFDFMKLTWSKPFNLTNPTQLTADPIVAVDSNGNSLVIWSIYDGEFYHIQSAIMKKCKHCWIFLDEIIVDSADNLDVALDPSGNAVLVWRGRSGFKGIIQSATLQKGSRTWEQTADISPTNTQSFDPKVGVDKCGNAVVVWAEGISITHIAAAKLYYGSLTWINTTDLSPLVNRSISPDIAVDRHGNAVAIWKTFVDPNNTIVEAATLPAGEFTWSTPTTLASSLLILDPEVVVDKHGNAVGVWAAAEGIQTALLPFGKTWTSPITNTPPTVGAGSQRIAMTPNAFAVVVYGAQVFATSEEEIQTFHSKHLFNK